MAQAFNPQPTYRVVTATGIWSHPVGLTSRALRKQPLTRGPPGLVTTTPLPLGPCDQILLPAPDRGGLQLNPLISARGKNRSRPCFSPPARNRFFPLASYSALPLAPSSITATWAHNPRVSRPSYPPREALGATESAAWALGCWDPAWSPDRPTRPLISPMKPCACLLLFRYQLTGGTTSKPS
jgi:hypothetical protein